MKIKKGDYVAFHEDSDWRNMENATGSYLVTKVEGNRVWLKDVPGDGNPGAAFPLRAVRLSRHSMFKHIIKELYGV